MKPTRIEEDTHEAHAKRQQEHAAATRLTKKLNLDQDDRPFTSATQMLSWFFEHYEHSTSIPAIDPARDVIQGSRVDMDKRHWKIKSAEQALRHLVKTSGDAVGAYLVWLHLRPRRKTGERRKRGVIIPIWSDPVPLWDLYQAPELVNLGKTDKRYRLSQRKARQAYLDALNIVERFAVDKGWLEARPHRPRTEQTYRREHQ